MTWLKDKELCFGQDYTCKVHNKKEIRLKGASKGINFKYKEGYLAMWLMIFKELRPQSSYQMHMLMTNRNNKVFNQAKGQIEFILKTRVYPPKEATHHK